LDYLKWNYSRESNFRILRFLEKEKNSKPLSLQERGSPNPLNPNPPDRGRAIAGNKYKTHISPNFEI